MPIPSTGFLISIAPIDHLNKYNVYLFMTDQFSTKVMKTKSTLPCSKGTIYKQFKASLTP